MSGFYIYSKYATLSEIKSMKTDKHIPKEKWIDVVNNDNDYYWKDNTLMGQRRINDTEHPLDPIWYYTQVFCFPDKDGYSNFLINYNYKYIDFEFTRVSVQKLEKMWQLAHDLDCNLIFGVKIIDDKMFQKLLEKYDRSKKG